MKYINSFSSRVYQEDEDAKISPGVDECGDRRGEASMILGVSVTIPICRNGSPGCSGGESFHDKMARHFLRSITD